MDRKVAAQLMKVAKARENQWVEFMRRISKLREEIKADDLELQPKWPDLNDVWVKDVKTRWDAGEFDDDLAACPAHVTLIDQLINVVASTISKWTNWVALQRVAELKAKAVEGQQAAASQAPEPVVAPAAEETGATLAVAPEVAVESAAADDWGLELSDEEKEDDALSPPPSPGPIRRRTRSSYAPPAVTVSPAKQGAGCDATMALLPERKKPGRKRGSHNRKSYILLPPPSLTGSQTADL